MSSPTTTPFLAAWTVAALTLAAPRRPGNEPGDRFRKDVQPILAKYCYDCHADSANKGKVAFDEFKSDDDLLRQPRALAATSSKNVRAGLHAAGREADARPTRERQTSNAGSRHDAFGIDPADPDPGRVTLRRLNRDRVPQHDPRPDRGRLQHRRGVPPGRHRLRLRHHRRRADRLAAPARKVHAGGRGDR